MTIAILISREYIDVHITLIYLIPYTVGPTVWVIGNYGRVYME